MITAFDENVTFAACKGARQPQSRHHGFRATVGISHQFDRRHHLGHAVRHDQFSLGRQRKHATNLHAQARRFVNAVIRIAENGRAITQAVINVTIVVDVPGAPALAMLHIDRAVIAPIPKRRSDAERQTLQRLLEMGV